MYPAFIVSKKAAFIKFVFIIVLYKFDRELPLNSIK